MAATQKRYTIVGVFEDRRHADQAVTELKKAGFRDDEIGVAMRHAHGEAADAAGETEAGEGAVAGALTGAGLGALAGLGVLSGVIPVIGPAIAAGTLGIILSNAAAGAAVAGLAGALIGYGIPEEDAQYYHEEFEAGRAVVTVQADGRADEAMTIIRRHGGYDRSMRNTAGARTATADRAAATATDAGWTGGEGESMQLKEERLHVEKHPVQAGEVRIGKEVHTETKHMDIPIEREEVVVERHPVQGRAIPGEIGAGEEIRVPVREEQVSVHKDVVVTEEVGVGKRTVQDTKRVSGEVRKEEARIERKGDVDVHSAGTRKDRT